MGDAMRRIAAALAAFALCSSPAAADRVSAPTELEQQVMGLGAWSSRLQNAVAGMVTPLGQLPQPPSLEFNRAQRREWAASARAWSAQAGATFAALEVDLAQLPASPPADAPISAEFRSAMEQSRLGIMQVLRRAGALARSYGEMADAFERGRDDAFWQLRISSLDASMLMIDTFRGINESQAVAMTENEAQRALFFSYARSYDGLSAILAFKRQIMATQRVDNADREATAVALERATREMRRRVAEGRAAARAAVATYSDPAASLSGEASLIQRIQRMLGTYQESFDREAIIASDLETAVAYLRDGRDYAVMEPELDAVVERIGVMDAERVADAQARQAIMTAP